MHVGVTASLAFLLSAASSNATDPRATAVVERTHETRATYSLYVWTRITPPGREPIEEWAAEFNSGSMHRVETPRDRVLADCDAMTGTILHVVTGEMVRSPAAASMACGIDAQANIVRSKWLGRAETPFGPADRILLSFADGARSYEVAENGALLAETIFAADGNLRVTNSAIEMSASLPADDIFTEESLLRSVVPEQFKQKPAASIIMRATPT
jgi:hypothetical protein